MFEPQARLKSTSGLQNKSPGNIALPWGLLGRRKAALEASPCMQTKSRPRNMKRNDHDRDLRFYNHNLLSTSQRAKTFH